MNYYIVIIEAEEQRVWGVYSDLESAYKAELEANQIYNTRIERV